MALGLLKVSGTIDVSQFWPEGTSDADTTKILVNVDKDSFKFRPYKNAPFKVTKAFKNAYIKIGSTKKELIKKDKITVRLQGIDAPELHYRPVSQITDKKGRTKNQKKKFLEVNEEYRQYLAETATVKLSEFLKKSKVKLLHCTVETYVDEPNDVFDKYGRLVGDIIVKIGGKTININHWLVQNGCAYPAFYNSMSNSEIQELLNLTITARKSNKFLWSNLKQLIKDFDWDLLYRRPSKKPKYNLKNDIGAVIFPKLFRRLSTWEVNKYAGMVTTSFWSYIENKKDECYLTRDFLNEPTAAHMYGLHDFLHIDGRFDRYPEEIVFREAKSRIMLPGGKEVNW